MFRRTFSAIALSIGFLFTGADATAQLIEAARIEILPSATPSLQDRVTARISYEQVSCYTFTSSVTTQPGGVFDVRVSPVSVGQPFPCTQTFDVDLGVLPLGDYSVLFYVVGSALASARFTVGIIPIPAVSESGIAVLVLTLALTAIALGRKGRRSSPQDPVLSVLLLGGASIVGTMAVLMPASAIEVAGRSSSTDLIVRFSRKVETRTVSELVDALNGSRDFSLSSRLLGPVSARRLIRREPTAYERDVIARHPSALVSQMFEYIVLTYDSARDLQSLAESLRLSIAVESVERVQVIKRAAVDPLLGTPSGSSDNSQWALHALSLPSAWLMTKGRATIAYLDSGLVTAHEDLASNFRAHLSRNVTFSGPGSRVTNNLEDEHYVPGSSTNYPGHGTHVAGIVAATNDNGLGISGSCPKCSLIAVKDSDPSTDGFVNSIDFAIAAGVQVINYSGELFDNPCLVPATDPRSWCKALGRAREAGISIIAAAGKRAGFGTGAFALPPAPANSEGVIAVGGLQPGPVPGDTSGQATFWRGDIVNPPAAGRRFGSDYHAKAGYYFLSPAAQVLSTFPSGVTYATVDAPFAQWGCADALGAPGTAGYGNCTGTSMAAPHIAAIAGLVRSVQPTLGYATTAYLMGSTPNTIIGVRTQLMEALSQPAVSATMPNASSVVQAALGGGSNRLTPLFSFYSSARAGHFYTSSPQSGKSALVGTLIPSTATDSTVPDGRQYLPVGNLTSGYGCFPPDMADTSPVSCTLGFSPRALVEVFTTEVSPYGGSLLPLYRLSRVQSGSVKYTYETDEARKSGLVGQGWRVDGVEGFVMPTYQPGAARLCRKFNASSGDYVLFPGSGATGDDCSAQSECHLAAICGPSGYSSSVSTDYIGYAFPSPDASDNDADGLPNYVELREGRNPSAKDNDIFPDSYSGRRLFSMQTFRDFLNREGDEGGIYYWTNSLAQGTATRSSLIEAFFTSAEHQGIIAPVARLYFAYFSRIPDYVGLNYWVGQSRGGMAVSAISQLFANSEEFQLTYGSLTNRQFVQRVYLNVLGRDPDQGGWDHWTGQLDAGMPRGQLMFLFSESAEYLATSHSKVYVNMMYMGMLRRAPDQGGFDYWVGYLNGGNSGQNLIGLFVASPEYRLRFLPN